MLLAAIWRTILVSNISPSYSEGTHPQDKCAISTSSMWGYLPWPLCIVPARQGFDLHFPIPVPQMWSGLPRNISTGAKESYRDA